MTFLVIAVVLFGWFCLFRIIPNCLVSLFRYRLWRKRDALYDEVRTGKFHGTKQAYELVRDMEAFIEGAAELSPVNIGLLWATHRHMPTPDEVIDMKSMDARDRRRLTKHLIAFQKDIAKHVFLETPSGWILTLLASPLIGLALLASAFQRMRNKRDDDNGDFTDNAQRRIFWASLGLLQAGEYEHPEPLSHAI
jgi:hypothetical protein